MIQKNKLLKPTIIYGLGDLFSVFVISIAILPFLVFSLSDIDYAKYLAIRANLELFLIVSHFGIVSAYARLFFDHNYGSYSLLNSALLNGLFVISFFSILLFLFGKNFENISGYEVIFFLISIAAINFALNSTLYRNSNDPKKFIFLQISRVMLFLGILFLLKIFDLIKLIHIFYALFVSYFLPPFLIGNKSKITLNLNKKIFSFALPLAIGLVSVTMLNKFNLFYLQSKIPILDYGSYAIYVQIGILFSMIAASIGKSVQPYMWSDSDKNIYQKSIHSFLFLLFFLSVFLILIGLFGKFIFMFLTPDTFIFNSKSLILVCIAYLILGLTLISDSIILFYKKPYLSTSLVVISAFLSIYLSIILVPKFGLNGAIYSQLISSTIFFIISYFSAILLLRNKYK